MSKRTSTLAVLGGMAAAAAAGIGAYALAIRLWHLRWGTIDEEAEGPMPGDDLLPEVKIVAIHAITIYAPAAEVWPWLVQWGYERGGFYSYDWIHRALGSEGVSSAYEILPEHQHLEVGDPVLVAPEAGFRVAALDPGKAIVLESRYDMDAGAPMASDEPLPDNYMLCSWAWLLRKLDEAASRLVIRMKIDYHPSPANRLIYRAFIEPGSFVMERKMMLGIKERAEAHASREVAGLLSNESG